LSGEHIGAIEIEEHFSTVDLPVGMPKDIFMDLKKVRVCGERLDITRFDSSKPAAKGKPKFNAEAKRKPKPRSKAGGKGSGKRKGKSNSETRPAPRKSGAATAGKRARPKKKT
jgi:ATP-dependent RNA helicase DeaD